MYSCTLQYRVYGFISDQTIDHSPAGGSNTALPSAGAAAACSCTRLARRAALPGAPARAMSHTCCFVSFAYRPWAVLQVGATTACGHDSMCMRNLYMVPKRQGCAIARCRPIASVHQGPGVKCLFKQSVEPYIRITAMHAREWGVPMQCMQRC